MQAFLDFGYVFFYSLACAIFLPLPSEAPMFLFPGLSRVMVLTACALGKGVGAYIVLLAGTQARRTNLLNKAAEAVQQQEKLQKFEQWTESFMKTYGFIGYLALMSVPGMPMRSAIYSSSALGGGRLKYALGAALSTIVRNLLVYFGYKSLF